MQEPANSPDYEGSYLLGEADGEVWSGQAHPNDTQLICMLKPEDIGDRDVFGQENFPWLREKAEQYACCDERFDASPYFEGFLTAVRRSRQMHAFASAGRRAF